MVAAPEPEDHPHPRPQMTRAPKNRRAELSINELTREICRSTLLRTKADGENHVLIPMMHWNLLRVVAPLSAWYDMKGEFSHEECRGALMVMPRKDWDFYAGKLRALVEELSP